MVKMTYDSFIATGTAGGTVSCTVRVVPFVSAAGHKYSVCCCVGGPILDMYFMCMVEPKMVRSHSRSAECRSADAHT